MEEKLDLIIDQLSNLSDNPAHVIFDEAELSKVLKVTNKTLRNWRAQGLVGYSKVQGKIFYRLSDVLAMLESNYTPPII